MVAQTTGVHTRSEPMNYYHLINIDRDITCPEDFSEEINTIRMAAAGDICHIVINTYGGSVDTALAITAAMNQSAAHIVTEAVGCVASAGTLIFLCGDEYRVNDDLTFMIHSASYFYGGKHNNVVEYVDFQKKSVTQMINKYYKHFLTDEEIANVLAGKDLWLDTDEVIERLEKRKELLDKEEAIEDLLPEVNRDYFKDMTKDQILDELFGEDDAIPKEEKCAGFSADGGVYNKNGELLFTIKNTPKQIANNFASAKEIKEIADDLGVTYPKTASKLKVAELIHKFLEEEIFSEDK
jgi:ATP-dependent protease ClpP protease subunit